MTKLRESQVSIQDGITLSYVEQGASQAPPLLLIHGYGDSWRSYEPLLAELPRSIRAIALSQRGYGNSTKPDVSYGVRDFAEDLAKFMDRLGIASGVLVGHSMGSLVAQRFAIDRPDCVRGLVLIGAFATLKGNAGGEELWTEHVAAMTDPVDVAFVRAFQESTLAGPVDADFFETVIAESCKVPAHVWRKALRAMLDDDSSGDLHRIAGRSLIVWGDRDGFSSRSEQERLRAALGRATLTICEGVGHDPHWEQPARVAALIVEFLGEAARA